MVYFKDFNYNVYNLMPLQLFNDAW